MATDEKKHATQIKWLVIVCVVVCAIVGFRVVMNIIARNEQANQGRGRIATVTSGTPLRQTIRPHFRFSGTLDPVWQANVAAKVDGRIERVLVKEGQRVSAGQALVVLEQTDTDAAVLQAKGSLLDAQASLEKAKSDYTRQQYLFEKGAISQEEFDNARFALNNAQGRLDNAKGALDSATSKSLGTTVTTPRQGIIQKRYFQEGYYAKVGTELFEIADISSLLAKIDIPEGNIQDIAVGDKVAFSIPAMKNVKVVGTITRISPVAQKPSRTFEAEVTVNNENETLRGGVYAEANITGQPKENVLTIPLSSIVMRDDQRTVYVIENEVAVRRILTTGYIGEDIVEILDGLKDDDVIITGGTNKVRDGSKVRVVETLKDGDE